MCILRHLLQNRKQHCIHTEKSGCLELTSRCLTMGQPSYIFSCNIWIFRCNI